MKNSEPFIGITCDVHVPRHKRRAYELFCDHRYPEAVKRAGGYPVLLPIAHREAVIERYLGGIDGLIIVGGDDVDPRLYGERPRRGTGTVFGPRLHFECELYRGARARDLPIFGICYGMQLINVLEGGALFQDVRRDAKSRLSHRDKQRPYHRVVLSYASRLHKIIGQRSIVVHSWHHQAASRVAPGFRPVALAPDGVIEAIESDYDAILAVQWHPERQIDHAATRRLFQWFVRLCARRAGAHAVAR